MSTECGALLPIYFCGHSFQSKYELQEYIDEQKEDIERAKRQLQKLVYMTEPSKFAPKDEDIDFWLDRELQENIESLEDSNVALYKAERMMEYWDNMHHKNGGAYESSQDPEKEARMWGDYICEVKEDGSPVHYEDDYDKQLYRNTTGQDWDIKDNKPIKLKSRW